MCRLDMVAASKSLDRIFDERIFQPLGMDETAFFVDQDDGDRLAALYTPDPATGKATRLDALGDLALKRPRAHLGGGGLVSTAADYHRFTQMLLNEGELD